MKQIRNKNLGWLFFDLNSFFASVEQQDRPELRNKPVAVVPMLTDSTCAIAASYEAKAYGIKTGTKIYEAKRMCPDLICVMARHDIYVRYHHAIMQSVERRLHIDQICSIDEAACRLPKQFQTPQAARALAVQIKQGLAQDVGAHIKCSIGLAGNKYLAKIATELQKPDGLVVLPPGEEEDLLCQLALRDLTGIGPAMERRLSRAGITTVRQLFQLSPKQARQIWGNVGGERLWYKLRGYDIPDQPTKTSMIGHSRVLDPAHRAPELAYYIARTLTLKAVKRLRATGLYARRFGMSVRGVSGLGWGREHSFSPANDEFTALRAFDALWQEAALIFTGQSLKKVSVHLYDFYEPQQVTLDLFDVQDPKVAQNKRDESNLSQVLDMIQEKFGKDTIRIGGNCPQTSAGNVGTKIAFTRVPDAGEF